MWVSLSLTLCAPCWYWWGADICMQATLSMSVQHLNPEILQLPFGLIHPDSVSTNGLSIATSIAYQQNGKILKWLLTLTVKNMVKSRKVWNQLGCSTGHTIPVTCNTTPVTGAVYRGMGLSCGFCLDTVVSIYCGILLIPYRKTAGIITQTAYSK